MKPFIKSAWDTLQSSVETAEDSKKYIPISCFLMLTVSQRYVCGMEVKWLKNCKVKAIKKKKVARLIIPYLEYIVHALYTGILILCKLQRLKKELSFPSLFSFL